MAAGLIAWLSGLTVERQGSAGQLADPSWIRVLADLSGNLAIGILSGMILGWFVLDRMGRQDDG
ncbi:MAG: hypothetical protein ACYCX5_13015 [Coriobacteriia bacterium]